MKSITGATETHGITIKVFDNLDKMYSVNEEMACRKPSLKVTRPINDKKFQSVANSHNDKKKTTAKNHESMESTIYVSGTSNLPGLSKNLFQYDEICSSKIKRVKGREDRKLLPGFSNGNKSVSKKYNDLEGGTYSLKTASKQRD